MEHEDPEMLVLIQDPANPALYWTWPDRTFVFRHDDLAQLRRWYRVDLIKRRQDGQAIKRKGQIGRA